MNWTLCWASKSIEPLKLILVRLHLIIYVGLLSCYVVFTYSNFNFNRYQDQPLLSQLRLSYLVIQFAAYDKGQLISEGLFKVFICTKKRTKIILYFCPKIDFWVRAPLEEIFFLFNFFLSKCLVIYFIQINKKMY